VRRSCSVAARLSVAVAACLLVTACRPAAKLAPRLPATTPTAERLVETLAERRAALRSIRGFAQIAYETGDDNLGARHAVLVRSPDHFRLEVLSPFGALAVIATDARELVVYARREAKIYRGPASAASVGAYTQVPVEVADVTSILLGSPPDRSVTGPMTVTRDDAAKAFKLTMPVAGGRQLVWFDPETLVPVASETPLGDGLRLRVAFGEYRDIGTFRFPHAIDMQAEPGARVVRVRYATPSVNTDIADNLFRFPPREGLQELVIEQYPTGGGG
jgi:outer membrane lipoprotein-sorting protein